MAETSAITAAASSWPLAPRWGRRAPGRCRRGRTGPDALTVATAAAVFDPATSVADLKAAGFSIFAMREPPQPGWGACRPAYCIGPEFRGTFCDRRYLAVMTQWSDAMDACPDHVERVVAYLGKRDLPTSSEARP